MLSQGRSVARLSGIPFFEKEKIRGKNVFFFKNVSFFGRRRMLSMALHFRRAESRRDKYRMTYVSWPPRRIEFAIHQIFPIKNDVEI
jgi:hypothetical protein